jgi:hypothetical protein
VHYISEDPKMTEYVVDLPNLYIDGRAIAVDLSNVSLPKDPKEETSVKHPHMTVLFRREGYSQADLNKVLAEAREWMKFHNADTAYFTLEPWGPRSKLVKGPLEWFGQHLRDVFGPQDRPLHVELYSNPKYK